MNKRPNVLFFFTDDQRFDTIRALGNGAIRTPNLDALAASGTVFTHAHIPGGSCGAVCMPSRAMLHTGRTLYHIKGQGEEIPPNHVTLAESLRQSGYLTFGTGKWHNGTASYARGFECGDEIFFGGMEDHWMVPLCQFDPTGRYERYAPCIRNPWRTNTVEQRRGDHFHAGQHSTDIFADSSIRFIEKWDGARPFFMYTSLMAPHDPRSMPEEFLKLYDPDKIELPPNFVPEHSIDTGALRIRDEVLAAIPRIPQEIRRHIAEYYAMISHLDAALGRVLDALRKKGALANTIIVFSGDNGLAVGQHGLLGKQNVYDHSVRVPLIFAGPGIPKGRQSDALVYLLDIFPTLCGLTGTPIPDSVEGVSLIPCLKDQTAILRQELYLAYENSIRGLTDGRQKLIEYACGATQLFDLVTDPFETRNLAELTESQTALSRLRQRLVQTAREWDDAAHHTGAAFWQRRADLNVPRRTSP
jgi:arylsulfatase A-like enzyme